MKHQHTDLNDSISALTRVDRRLTISFSVLILVLMLLVLFTNGLHLKGVMDKEEKQLSTLLTKILATSISRISFSGRYHAQLLLEDTQKENPNIKYLRIIDLNSKIYMWLFVSIRASIRPFTVLNSTETLYPRRMSII